MVRSHLRYQKSTVVPYSTRRANAVVRSRPSAFPNMRSYAPYIAEAIRTGLGTAMRYAGGYAQQAGPAPRTPVQTRTQTQPRPPMRTPPGQRFAPRRVGGAPRAVSRANGVYAGRLPKARRNKKDPYVAKGFKHVVETSGVVSDPDCVYVGHSSYAPQLALQMVTQAILRRLFEKAGLTITSLSDPIFPTAVALTDGYFIRLETITATGVINNYDYGVPALATILSITGNVSNGVAGTWPTFANVLYDYALGENPLVGTKATDDLMQIRLFNEVVGASNASRYNTVCTLNLRDMMVNFHAESEIKIQNRTVSASGSEDAEAVSANPLYLKKFLFNGIPRQKDKTTMFKLPPASTCIMTTGAGNAGNTYMKEPVSPKLFWNCYKNSQSVLNPGQIRSDKIKLHKNMRLMPFLRFIGLLIDANGKTNAVKGPFMLYALEDVINVNLAQLITIAYECNRTLGLFVYNKPRKFATGGVYQNTQDNEYEP